MVSMGYMSLHQIFHIRLLYRIIIFAWHTGLSGAGVQLLRPCPGTSRLRRSASHLITASKPAHTAHSLPPHIATGTRLELFRRERLKKRQITKSNQGEKNEIT